MKRLIVDSQIYDINDDPETMGAESLIDYMKKEVELMNEYYENLFL